MLKQQNNGKSIIAMLRQYFATVGTVLAILIISSCSQIGDSSGTSSPANDSKIRDIEGMTMIYVPGDTFKMGSADSDKDAGRDEKPQHEVTVDSFWVDMTEVTNAQYQNCVGDGSCNQSKYADEERYNGANYPVVGVDWNDARSYCQWMGGRLPTEAEWEYVARGKDGNIYPWGNEFDGTKAKYYGDNYVNIATVGSLPAGASWVGALDMAGNVWEWTQSEYKDYPYDANDGREDIGKVGVFRVLRGGSIYYFAKNIRGAYRRSFGTDGKSYDIGFRCVIVESGN